MPGYVSIGRRGLTSLILAANRVYGQNLPLRVRTIQHIRRRKKNFLRAHKIAVIVLKLSVGLKPAERTAAVIASGDAIV